MACLKVSLYLIIFYIKISQSLHPDTGLDIIQLAVKHGYHIELHDVETDDGYILGTHRIFKGVSSAHKPPVLLFHGLLCSSVDYVNLGPNISLGFRLADEGYDVWLGNQRGNTWSKKHVYLDVRKDAKKFYDFSLDEIALYDLPALIDYVRETTQVRKIPYIGYSQGTITFFMLTSAKPEYNRKILLMNGMGPSAYLGNDKRRNIIARIGVFFYPLLRQIHFFNALLPYSKLFLVFAVIFCRGKHFNVCRLGMNILTGFDTLVDTKFLPVIFSNFPAGASWKQFIHYLQLIKSDKFCRFDYKEKNILHYGLRTPPCYDLSNVIAPVRLFYSDNDLLITSKDTEKTAKAISNVVDMTKVSWRKFNHFEYMWSVNASTLVYDDIIDGIEYFFRHFYK